jgi:hypothetical protein
MEDYDVIPQRITPLLSLSGHNFEEGIEADLAKRLPTWRKTPRRPTTPTSSRGSRGPSSA